MKRYYYISSDLDDLEAVEKELESNGVTTPQIHVLSSDDAEVEKHNLNSVEAVLKKDVVHSTQKGAMVGALGAVAVLVISYLAGFTNTVAGWVPFIFLAVVILGFCTWEGGFMGIQSPHYQLKRFQNALNHGKHVLFVDVDPDQESLLSDVVARHDKLRPAGVGESRPRWVVRGQDKFNRFVDIMP